MWLSSVDVQYRAHLSSILRCPWREGARMHHNKETHPKQRRSISLSPLPQAGRPRLPTDQRADDRRQPSAGRSTLPIVNGGTHPAAPILWAIDKDTLLWDVPTPASSAVDSDRDYIFLWDKRNQLYVRPCGIVTHVEFCCPVPSRLIWNAGY